MSTLVTSDPGNTIRAIVAEEMARPLFDEYLDAFHALPETPARNADGTFDIKNLPTEAIRVRRWDAEQARPQGVERAQVRGFHRGIARVMRVAYEIEDPWRQLAMESVEFMDHNGLQRFALFMDSVWQNDERRHAAVLRTAYRKVTGGDSEAANPHFFEPYTAGAVAFERHLLMRLCAEVAASSTYSVLASHGRHEFEGCMRNLAGDEFRHLAIFWAAIKWRFGGGAWRRLSRFLRRLAEQTMGPASLDAAKDAARGLDVQQMFVGAQIGATIGLVLYRLMRWDDALSEDRLLSAFGPRPAAWA